MLAWITSNRGMRAPTAASSGGHALDTSFVILSTVVMAPLVASHVEIPDGDSSSDGAGGWAGGESTILAAAVRD